MKRKRKAIVFILILLLLSTAGCFSNNDSNTTIKNQQTPENSKISDAEENTVQNGVGSSVKEALQESKKDEYALFVDIYDSHTGSCTISDGFL